MVLQPGSSLVTAAPGSCMKVPLAATSIQPPPEQSTHEKEESSLFHRAFSCEKQNIRPLKSQTTVLPKVLFHVHFLLFFLKSPFSSAAVFWVKCKTILVRWEHWDRYFPQHIFILVEWVKEQPVPAEMSQIRFSLCVKLLSLLRCLSSGLLLEI